MEKHRWEESEKIGEEKKREDQRRERVRRKKMQVREKVGKSRNTVFLEWFVAPEGRKVGSLKRQVRSHLAKWEMKNYTSLWRKAHLEVKMYKRHHSRTTFGSWDVKKVYAIVARSTFPSQNVQNTPGSDHFWKLRCRKSARRRGAKHISKSSGKKWGVRSTFRRSDVVLRGRHKGFCTLPKVNKTWRFCSSFNYNQQHYTTLHYTPLQLQLQLELHYTTPQYTTLQYNTLPSTTLRYTTINRTTLHYTTPHYTTLTTTRTRTRTTTTTTLHHTTLH